MGLVNTNGAKQGYADTLPQAEPAGCEGYHGDDVNNREKKKEVKQRNRKVHGEGKNVIDDDSDSLYQEGNENRFY